MGLLDRVRGTAEVAPELDPEGGTSTLGAAGGGKAKAHVPHLDDEVADAAKVASLSLFSDREIKHLWKLFNQIDADATGSISSDEMLQLPQLKYNPLGKRVIVATFQTKEHKSADTLSFNDFVEVLSVFAPAASDQEKLKLAFKVFDFDGDRFLGRSDLEQLGQPQVDLMLIHAPGGAKDNSGCSGVCNSAAERRATWQGLEQAMHLNLTRAIG